MLKCKDISHQASDYLEHNLGFSQRMGFAMHLLICGNCREFVAHLRKAIQTFNRQPTSKLSPQETDKIVDQTLNRADEN